MYDKPRFRDESIERRINFDPKGLLAQRFDVERHTVVVDFQVQTEAADNKWATACVRVNTSNGKTGTISHLDISNDPALFVADLKKKVGKGVPVILDGGYSDSGYSMGLLKGVHSALLDEGFIVAPLDDKKHNDVGGNMGRKAILRSDGVDVIKNEEGGEGGNIFLTFPK